MDADKELLTREVSDEISLAQCPGCGQRMTLPPGAINKGVKCPRCQEKTLGVNHIIAKYKLDEKKTEEEILNQE